MSTELEKIPVKGLGQGPLFVVGMWRSGTSLFYALMNQHPKISLLYEGDLPLLWPLFLGSKAKADWPERWEFWNLGPTRHQLPVDRLPRNAGSLREAAEAVYELHAGDGIGGCKSPNYFDMLPGLAEKFPTAKFIVIWRNPADICRSVARAGKGDTFFAKPGMVLRVLRGYEEMKRGYDTLVAQGTSVHAVQYETLVEDPTGVMSGVCKFLNIDFDPRMTSLQDADRSAIYEGDHHEGVKSVRVAPMRPKAECLSPEVLQKIQNYVAMWHKRYQGEWPAEPENAGSPPANGFGVEEFFDSIRYRGYRMLDWFIVFVYCFAPLSLLRKYRAMRGRGEAAPAKPGREGNLVGASAKD